MEQLKTYLTSAPTAVATLEPQPQCEACLDNGIVAYREGEKTKTRPCPNKNCLAGQAEWRRRIKVMQTRSEMPGRYQDYNDFRIWEGLDDYYIEGKVTAILAARRFVDDPMRPYSKAELHPRYQASVACRHSMVLWGVRGMGKTALASTMTNLLIAKLIGVQFITPRGLWFRLKATFGKEEGETENSIIRELIDVPVLVIDEFNLRPSDYLITVIEHVVRERYNSLTPKPIVATSNADKAQLVEIWKGQTISALAEMAHFIPMGGKALRDEAGEVEEEAF